LFIFKRLESLGGFSLWSKSRRFPWSSTFHPCCSSWCWRPASRRSWGASSGPKRG